MQTLHTIGGHPFYIDDDDLPFVSMRRWGVTDLGYIRATYAVDGERFLHRLLLKPEPGLEVDHIDRNPSNNCRSNLRIATRAQQQQNRGMFANNTTGYKGVSKHAGKWQASIRVNGKLIYLGRFNTPEEASIAYQARAELEWGSK